ncbi:MAG TPA: DUF1016 N-terminal domain-containing protein [Flavisolibacter sp.]|nr:DUF1016 N-terminal domain-containing protein [Flavisolibacter sp.]
MKKNISKNQLFLSIKEMIEEIQSHVIRNINTVMVIAYFKMGQRIVEEEQKGKARADYSKKILQQLSDDLTNAFEGYSVDNLENCRRFLSYLSGTEFRDSVSEF